MMRHLVTEDAEGRWVRLERGDSWGVQYLSYNAFNRSGHADPDRSIIVKKGTVVEVKWPDGTMSREKIVIREYRTTVSDMGHEYPVEYEIPGVFTKARGVRTWLPLDAPGIRVRANAFKSEVKPKGSRSHEELSNEGLISNPLALLENPILFENPLSGGAKVAVGVCAVAAVGAIAYILFSSKTASAAPQPAPAPKCPDGSLPPGGNLTNCPPPHMGPNDPDAPPGGWAYNGSVSANVQQAATALAAVDPCQKSSEQLVRNFQAAAGLTITGGVGDPNAVSPPGTDGRYGGDAQTALGQYVSNPPQACYSNANPNSRPSWWGAPGTYTNP